MINQINTLLSQNASVKSIIGLCILLTLPSVLLAAGKQSITCHGQGGGTKHIYIEHSPANINVCRTLYSPNGTQFKAIAWAQKSSQKCYDVANKLAARFQHVGWDCSLTDNTFAMDAPIADYKLASNNTPTLKTLPVRKKSKPKTQEKIEESTPADDVSSDNVETVSEEEILKTIER